MGLLGKLARFNRAVNDIEASKDRLKTMTDKSQWSEDDIRANKRSKLWSWINILLLIPVGVIIYFALGMFVEGFEMILPAFFILIIVGWAYGLSMRKAHVYTVDNAPGLGAHILDKMVMVLLVVTVIGVVLLRLCFGGLF